MVALIGAGYVTVIAVATVWAEWHRPSDTVAAMLLVLAWSAFAVLGTRLLGGAGGQAGRHHRATALLLLAVTVVAGAAGTLGLVAVAMSERVTPDLVSGRFAFLAGSAGIAAVVAGVFLVWLRVVAGGRAVGLPAGARKTVPAPARKTVPAAPRKTPPAAARKTATRPTKAPAKAGRPARRPKGGSKK
jgi:hypothetical protein